MSDEAIVATEAPEVDQTTPPVTPAAEETAPCVLPEGPCQCCNPAHEDGFRAGFEAGKTQVQPCDHAEQCCDLTFCELKAGFYLAHGKTHELWCGENGVEPICYEVKWQAQSALAALCSDAEAGYSGFVADCYIAEVVSNQFCWGECIE